MPKFRRDGHEKVTHEAFLDFVEDHLPQAFFFPCSQARLYMKLQRGKKKATAGGLDGWPSNEVKALSRGLLGQPKSFARLSQRVVDHRAFLTPILP